jgi:hypothetical protein
VLFNNVLGVQDLCEVERYLDMDVRGCCCVPSDIFEEEFWFHEVEALRINEFQVWIRKRLALTHFEEAIDDDDEFQEIGGKSSAKDIFLTFATDFRTEAAAREHHLQNFSCPN